MNRCGGIGEGRRQGNRRIMFFAFFSFSLPYFKFLSPFSGSACSEAAPWFTVGQDTGHGDGGII